MTIRTLMSVISPTTRCTARRTPLALALAGALMLPAALAAAADRGDCANEATDAERERCTSDQGATWSSVLATKVELGDDAVAGGARDIAIGNSARTDSSLSPGTDSPDYAIAIGPGAQVVGGGSLAMGGGASVLGAPTTKMKALALGNASTVSAEGGVAVGYDATASHSNSVALGAGATTNAANTVSVGNGVDNRRITNMADGVIAAGSADAITGAQLFSTNERVGRVESDIDTIKDDASKLGAQVGSLESGVGGLQTRMSGAEGSLKTLSDDVAGLADGSSGIVTHDSGTGVVSVAAGKGGTVVDFAGGDGYRRLSGVANGVNEDDVVTIAQLRAAGAIDPVSGETLSVLTYDDASLSRASLGGTGGTVLDKVAAGQIGQFSMEAVNGSQLWQMNANWEAQWRQMDDRLGSIERGIEDGSIGGPGTGNPGTGNPGVSPGTGEGSVAIGEGSDASGKGAIGLGNGSAASGVGAVAVGEGSVASGTGSVAMGEGASATGNNSVAVGAGSTADRDSEFSVGSQGNERVVSNVAAGVRPTDAVNVQQMDDRFKAEREYTDGRFNAMDTRLDRMGAISAAYAGMAINTAGLSGDNRVGAGVGSQNGRSALAVGFQRILGEKKNVSVSLGGAFSGSDQSVSAGAGFSW